MNYSLSFFPMSILDCFSVHNSIFFALLFNDTYQFKTGTPKKAFHLKNSFVFPSCSLSPVPPTIKISLTFFCRETSRRPSCKIVTKGRKE